MCSRKSEIHNLAPVPFKDRGWTEPRRDDRGFRVGKKGLKRAPVTLDDAETEKSTESSGVANAARPCIIFARSCRNFSSKPTAAR